MIVSNSHRPAGRILNVSIVAYRDDPGLLKELRDTLEETSCLRCLYLIDNGDDDELKRLFSVGRSRYIRPPSNIGFGRAHNIALRSTLDDKVPFHLVLNPDVAFDPAALDACVQHMIERADLALLMPKVLYPDGRLQRLCKLLPNPLLLASRRLLPVVLRRNWDRRYELGQYDYKHELVVPALSGCFMLIRTEALALAGLFDEKYFMYMEDFDLCRRLAKWGNTVCWPKIAIYHSFARGSAQNLRLLCVHIRSAIYYFNKWGWFFDPARRTINTKTLYNLEQQKGK